MFSSHGTQHEENERPGRRTNDWILENGAMIEEKSMLNHKSDSSLNYGSKTNKTV